MKKLLSFIAIVLVQFSLVSQVSIFSTAKIPTQTGNAGKVLGTNGSVLSWTTTSSAIDVYTTTASSSTINLASISASYIGITGTVTVNNLGTVSAGEKKYLLVLDSFNLTASSNIILPSDLSIYARQNDVFILNKHTTLHEIEYKTIISNFLGIDGRKIRRKYELDEIIKKEGIDTTSLKSAQDDLQKVIEENKTLISSRFIDRLKYSVAKYGKIILNKEVTFLIDLNSSNDIEFSINVKNDENSNDNLNDEATIKKLLCLIFASALAETYAQKRLIKFVAFDSPFDGNKNTYEEGIYRAINLLNRIGIQTIITSNENVIRIPEILSEIKNEYLTDYFSNKDKLMGDF